MGGDTTPRVRVRMPGTVHALLTEDVAALFSTEKNPGSGTVHHGHLAQDEASKCYAQVTTALLTQTLHSGKRKTIRDFLRKFNTDLVRKHWR